MSRWTVNRKVIKFFEDEAVSNDVCHFSDQESLDCYMPDNENTDTDRDPWSLDPDLSDVGDSYQQNERIDESETYSSSHGGSSGSSSNESFSDDDIPNNTFNLHDELLYFFIMFNISHAGMKFLLLLFKKCGLNVPQSMYLFLKKQKSSFVEEKFSNGNFTYFGIKGNLEYLITNNLLDKLGRLDNIHISINIDGLPLFRSSRMSATPILMKIHGLDRPLIVGIYCGVEKPPLNEFLKQLVEELNALTTIGINLNGLFFKFTKVLFICDAPAHAWICGIKGHNAYMVVVGVGQLESMTIIEWFIVLLLLHRSEDHNKTSSKDVDVVAILPLTNKEQYMLFVEKLDDKDFKRNVIQMLSLMVVKDAKKTINKMIGGLIAPEFQMAFNRLGLDYKKEGRVASDNVIPFLQHLEPLLIGALRKTSLFKTISLNDIQQAIANFLRDAKKRWHRLKKNQIDNDEETTNSERNSGDGAGTSEIKRREISRSKITIEPFRHIQNYLSTDNDSN